LPQAVDDRTGAWARSLTSIARATDRWAVTRKADLETGDRVLVSTKNSDYCLESLGGDMFHVTGGWFEKRPESRFVTVNGCTFGGSAIWTDIVAAPGLFLEFGNNVSTTRIRRVRVVRQAQATIRSTADFVN
jgi:hypothetical protein